MEAYVSPTMGDVKERKAGFKEKVFMFVSKVSPKGKSWLLEWETEHKKLSSMKFDGGAAKTKHKITTPEEFVQQQITNEDEADLQEELKYLRCFNAKEEFVGAMA
ncbi:hypothetical protein SLEP1_g25691 [Rubroshorea leprosula]|uniref:Uncharacterized protein n=1 Tax=Rubroshorea leprosula TaxID=152421 RepID=A0AAV5JJZ1_9ROSI|nr:hypothetical protein SLEP1_g25691 [Rubroshorea leprosula]